MSVYWNAISNTKGQAVDTPGVMGDTQKHNTSTDITNSKITFT